MGSFILALNVCHSTSFSVASDEKSPSVSLSSPYKRLVPDCCQAAALSSVFILLTVMYILTDLFRFSKF